MRKHLFVLAYMELPKRAQYGTIIRVMRRLIHRRINSMWNAQSLLALAYLERALRV
jgi:hypothetical protein